MTQVEATAPGTGIPETDVPEAPAAASAKKTRRQLSPTARRIIAIVAGLVVVAASVAGFYYTSDVFDERVPVLVAAVDIAAGDTISAASLTSERVVIGSIPHEPGDAQFLYDGMIAAQPIPAGGLVRGNLLIFPDTEPVGIELEVVVPLDTSIATRGVANGDTVLMIDPGALPTPADPGRPRTVMSHFRLENFADSQMTLFVPPEEWADWRSLLRDLGGVVPMVMKVPVELGADPDEMAQRIEAVWRAEWSALVEALSDAASGSAPGPGELEVFVPLDGSLVPTPVNNGDLVLLVDPGQAPDRDDAGRPRSVLQELLLDNYEGGLMRMFLPPEEWVRWRSLPERLGAPPMIIPVAPGTDTGDMAERLDAEWDRVWRVDVQVALTGTP